MKIPFAGESPSDTARSRLLWTAFLISATLLAYLPIWRAGFIWDDDSILTANEVIKDPAGLRRIWFSTDTHDYWPVTYSLLWLEWRCWGMQATGYHAVNLALHLVEAWLFWRLLVRLRLPGAPLAALLFALHPVNVETVAWIAQTKNLTAMVFVLLAGWCFIPAVLEPAPREGRLWEPGRGKWYALALLGFALALLGKGSAVILPGLFGVLIWWHRGLARGDALRLLPFALLGGIAAVANVWLQFHGSGEVVRDDGFVQRVLGAAAAVWFYLGKALMPFQLSFVYPRWEIHSGELLWWLPLLAAVAVSVVLWLRRDRGTRALWAGWLFFVAALLPVLGFADIYFMRYSLVADHYQHIALLGVTTLVAAGWAAWRKRANGAFLGIAFAAAALVVVAFGYLTYRETEIYRDKPTLWRATLARNPNSWLAQTIVGNLVADTGDHRAAIAHHERALKLNPRAFEVHFNLANSLSPLGRTAEAIAHYRESLRLRPRQADVHYNLANALSDTGQLAEALAHYRQSLALAPRQPMAHNNAGIALAGLKRLDEAVTHFRAAVALDPNFADGYRNLGIVLRALGRNAEAEPFLDRAQRLSAGAPAPR